MYTCIFYRRVVTLPGIAKSPTGAVFRINCLFTTTFPFCQHLYMYIALTLHDTRSTCHKSLLISGHSEIRLVTYRFNRMAIRPYSLCDSNGERCHSEFPVFYFRLVRFFNVSGLFGIPWKRAEDPPNLQNSYASCFAGRTKFSGTPSSRYTLRQQVWYLFELPVRKWAKYLRVLPCMLCSVSLWTYEPLRTRCVSLIIFNFMDPD